MGSNQIINMFKLIIKHIQTQINKQKVSLLQDQNVSNNIKNIITMIEKYMKFRILIKWLFFNFWSKSCL